MLADRGCEQDGLAWPLGDGGCELPSGLPTESQANVKQVIARTAAALGITVGAFGCEIALRGEEPCLIGVAAGLSGAFATRLIPLCTGVDVVGAAIRAALGETVPADEFEVRKSVPVVRLCAHLPSDLKYVAEFEDARKVPGVQQLSVVSGSRKAAYRNGRIGGTAAVVATAPSREAARNAARSALSLLPTQSAEPARSQA